MKRIGILTAGGDTPALNATISGAVVRANQCRVEVYGFIKGFSGLLDPEVPHVHLNPLFTEIPELDATHGGTILGASRAFVDAEDTKTLDEVANRIQQLGIDGHHLHRRRRHAQRPAAPGGALSDRAGAQDHRQRPRPQLPERARRVAARAVPTATGFQYKRSPSRTTFDLEDMVNYVTPGYATSVFVSSEGVRRIRTTAESHRRIAIIEVMGRHSGYIALGTAFGQPDIILVPEHPLERAGPHGARLGAVRATEERRDRLRRGSRRRDGPAARRAPARPRSRGQRRPVRGLGGAADASRREVRRRLLPEAPQGRIGQGRDLHP